MTLLKPTSFSQTDLFFTCPRTWYMQKILKIPGISDMCYADRGNVVHHCLETYYPDKIQTLEEVKAKFEKEWKTYKLDETKLKSKKDETWLMIINGINMNIDVTSTELKIFYPDVVGYIDVVDTKNGKISDWKTSTRASYNEKSYVMQLKYYSWLYYRKFKELPIYTDVKYLKYTGTKAELSCIPSMEDIEAAEKWHNEGRRRMLYYIKHPEKLPPFNKSYFFSPYKHLWDLEERPAASLSNFVIEIIGGFFYIKGDMHRKLKAHFDNKYSYELKSAKYIKQRNPDANTIVRLWSNKLQRLPIGFLKETMQSLHDFAMFMGKTPVINVVDKRIFDETIVEMSEKLLSGKELRPYQLKAVNTYLDRHKIGMVEISTGGGKSLCVTEIIRRLRIKTLFVVDRKELLIQMKETLEDNLCIEIGTIGAGKKDIRDVTVATIQTINKMLDSIGPIKRLKQSIKDKRWEEHIELSGIVIPFDDMEDSEMTMEQQDIRDKAYEKLEREQKKFFRTYKFTNNENVVINFKQDEVDTEVLEFKKELAKIRFLCMDECHKIASKSYFSLGVHCRNTEYRLGLCLNPSTKVFDEKGHIKKIKDININESVLSYNHNTKLIEPKKVLNVFKQNVNEKYEITIKTKRGLRKIVCSGKHKFFVDKKYIEAEKLEIGKTVSILYNPHSILDNKTKTEEVRKKLSKKLKGRIKSEEECRNISKGLKGNIPWNKNKKGLQKSHRKGISLFEEYSKKKAKKILSLMSKNSKDMWKTRHEELVLNMNNKQSINSNKPFFHYNKRKKIESQTVNGEIICEECDKIINGYKCVHCHHIDKNNKNNNLKNLKILCSKCHFNIHNNQGDRKRDKNGVFK